MPIPLIDTPDIEVLRVQFQAWMDGVVSRFLGLTVPDNPHESRSAAGDAWENGWDVCDHNLQRYSGYRAFNTETKRVSYASDVVHADSPADAGQVQDGDQASAVVGPEGGGQAPGCREMHGIEERRQTQPVGDDRSHVSPPGTAESDH